MKNTLVNSYILAYIYSKYMETVSIYSIHTYITVLNSIIFSIWIMLLTFQNV